MRVRDDGNVHSGWIPLVHSSSLIGKEPLGRGRVSGDLELIYKSKSSKTLYNADMPTLEIKRYYPTPPDVKELESQIITQRSEYAGWDVPEYQHVYLGFIEQGVENLLDVLDREISSFRDQHPEATFILEYHPSCIAHENYPFQVFSFTLIKKVQTPKGQRRQLMIMSWKVPHREDYAQENALIESFMADRGVEPFDDGSEQRCKITSVKFHSQDDKLTA